MAVVPGYRTFKISDELAFDFARALWMATRLNEREGISPPNPLAREKEALRRITLEWSSVALPALGCEPGLVELTDADWRCACGSTGLGSGGLQVTPAGVTCLPCREKAPQTR